MKQKRKQAPPSDSGDSGSKTKKVENIEVDGVLNEIDAALEKAEIQKRKKKEQKSQRCCGGNCCW